MRSKYFRTIYGKIELPVFFPDATRAVVKTVDSVDIKNTGTPGILVNTYSPRKINLPFLKLQIE